MAPGAVDLDEDGEKEEKNKNNKKKGDEEGVCYVDEDEVSEGDQRQSSGFVSTWFYYHRQWENLHGDHTFG